MDEKLRRQMQTLDRLYKESDRIGDDYAAHFGMNNTAFWVLYLSLIHISEPTRH